MSTPKAISISPPLAAKPSSPSNPAISLPPRPATTNVTDGGGSTAESTLAAGFNTGPEAQTSSTKAQSSLSVGSGLSYLPIRPAGSPGLPAQLNTSQSAPRTLKSRPLIALPPPGLHGLPARPTFIRTRSPSPPARPQPSFNPRSPSPPALRERSLTLKDYPRKRLQEPSRSRSRSRSALPINKSNSIANTSTAPASSSLLRRARSPPRERVYCVFFDRGHCAAGKGCRFVHDIDHAPVDSAREGDFSDKVRVDSYFPDYNRRRSRSPAIRRRYRSRSFDSRSPPPTSNRRRGSRSPSPSRYNKSRNNYSRRSTSPPVRPKPAFITTRRDLSPGQEAADSSQKESAGGRDTTQKRRLIDRIFGDKPSERPVRIERSPSPTLKRGRSPRPRSTSLASSRSRPRSVSSSSSPDAKRRRTDLASIPTGPRGHNPKNHYQPPPPPLPTPAPIAVRNAQGIPIGPKNPNANHIAALEHQRRAPHAPASSVVNDAQATRSLWLGAVPWPATGTPEFLLSIFSRFGPIESTRLVPPKSCAFVNFESTEVAVIAREALNGTSFLGSHFGPIRIGFGHNPDTKSLPFSPWAASGRSNIATSNNNAATIAAAFSTPAPVPTGYTAPAQTRAPLPVFATAVSATSESASTPVPEAFAKDTRISSDRLALIAQSTEDQQEEEDSEMPYRGRGSNGPSRGGGGGGGGRHGGRGHSAGGNVNGYPGRGILLDGPIRDRQYILDEYSLGGRVALKPAHAENPKSPLANFMGTASGYESEYGKLNGANYHRVSIIVDRERGIIGLGDATDKKEAEKLAALSAMYQLTAAGILDGAGNKANGHPTGSGGGGGGGGGDQSSSSETAQLSDGSTVTYERARLFMEYYCQRFNFKKPEIQFDQVTASHGYGKKHAGGSRWDAIMTVDGRRIGQGSAPNKKSANIQAYLDVVVYLEKCDHDLWRSFEEKRSQSKNQDVGTAPHLLFQCTDGVNEAIRQLCDDARLSTLFARAPAVGTATTTAVSATNNPVRVKAASELAARAKMLKNRLISYQSDPKLEAMRETRSKLPIFGYKQSIVDTINSQDVVVLTAATGSGKSTQVGSYILDDWIMKDKGSSCRIIITQPRRLAALSLADRVADERGQKLQQEVGYHVRFEPKTPEEDGSITFMTVGILLKRLQSALESNELSFFDTITHFVIDEVHERDIDTDLLLVILKRIIQDRVRKGAQPPKLILMSATIEAKVFQQYFTSITRKNIPILEIPGKIYPVTRYYLEDIVGDLNQRPGSGQHAWVFQDKQTQNYLQQEQTLDITKNVDLPPALVALTVAHVCAGSNSGHVLVFLPGLDEIKAVARVLSNETGRTPLPVDFARDPNYTIHTLHSTTPIAEQRQVFVPAPAGQRRVILATNIAETSVTIPGITVVVDSGKAKTKIYNPDRHVSSLISAWTGRANLDQRAGRAGRERAGTYIALLSQNRVKALSAHSIVEMLRLDLQEVIMHIKSMRMGAVEEVLSEAIEPPNPGRVAAAVDQLRLIGAVDAKQNLTPLGLILMHLPCDTKLGKLVVYGALFKALTPALTIAAVLGSRDPFMAPINMREQSNEIKDSFSPPAYKSDTLAVVTAFDKWWELQSQFRYHEATAFLGQNLLNKQTMLGIQLVREQLLNSLQQANVLSVVGVRNRLSRSFQVPKELDVNADSLPLKAALIALGSSPNFALRTSEKTCRTAHDKVCIIHTSSTNSRKRENISTTAPGGRYIPEKRIYAFAEKTSMGQNEYSGTVSLRNVTRLDPLSYLMFGASDLKVTEHGLESDDWLPITGNLDALDDLQRLRLIFDSCFGRIFEGVDQLRRERGGYIRRADNTSNSATNTRPGTPENDEEEFEEERGDWVDMELVKIGRGAARPAGKDWDARLSGDELTELDFLTGDVVKILDMYAEERDPTVSRVGTRPPSPMPVSAGGGAGGGGFNGGGGGGFGGAGGPFGGGGYR